MKNIWRIKIHILKWLFKKKANPSSNDLYYPNYPEYYHEIKSDTSFGIKHRETWGFTFNNCRVSVSLYFMEKEYRFVFIGDPAKMLDAQEKEEFRELSDEEVYKQIYFIIHNYEQWQMEQML